MLYTGRAKRHFINLHLHATTSLTSPISPPSIFHDAPLASDGPGASSQEGLVVVVRDTSGAVDVGEDGGVVLLVGAGELDGLGGGKGTGAGDLDLGARGVELSTHVLVGAVEGEELDAEEVVAGGDALGHGEVVPAVALDHVVDTPDAGAGVVVVLGDLEPVDAGVGGGGGVVDLGEPGGHGAVVGGGDGVVRVVGELGTADDVLPPGADLGTGGDGDDGLGLGGDDAAGDVGGLDVLDGVVLVGGAEADEGTLVLSVYGETLQRGWAC